MHPKHELLLKEAIAVLLSDATLPRYETGKKLLAAYKAEPLLIFPLFSLIRAIYDANSKELAADLAIQSIQTIHDIAKSGNISNGDHFWHREILGDMLLSFAENEYKAKNLARASELAAEAAEHAPFLSLTAGNATFCLIKIARSYENKLSEIAASSTGNAAAFSIMTPLYKEFLYARDLFYGPCASDEKPMPNEKSWRELVKLNREREFHKASIDAKREEMIMKKLPCHPGIEAFVIQFGFAGKPVRAANSGTPYRRLDYPNNIA